MKNIAILGSTGSIGTQTLEVVERNGGIKVTALSCGSNVALMEQQIRKFRPKLAAIYKEDAARDLSVRVRDLDVEIIPGMEGMLAVAEQPQSQMLVTGIVGMLGIRPTIAAINAGKDIALANKETLVTAGHLIMPLAKEKGVSILPVDSEHSAIFQSLQGSGGNPIRRILLTASGGPFRGRTRQQLQEIRPEDALKHPNWNMGAKVTIDSSTLVNKGLEVMEAKWLFDVSPNQIQVLVHPQSIVHSAVEYSDGAVIAQLGTPDMRLPIQYALYYPRRMAQNGNPLDLFEIANLTFERPDMENFRGLALAYEAIARVGSVTTTFNAANECAVSLFLQGRIRYLEIAELIEAAMRNCSYVANPNVEEILAAEQEAHDYVQAQLK